MTSTMLSTIRRIRFTPTLIPSLGALVGIAITTYLGTWQQSRAAEKRTLQTEFEARLQMQPIAISSATDGSDYRFRLATVIGEWSSARQIFIDNKVTAGVAGYDVIAPLRIDGSNRYILINRGWVPRSSEYPRAPTVPDPASGNQRVEGTLTIPTSKFLELGSEIIDGNVWQNLTIDRFRKKTGLDLLPFVLLADQTMPPLRPFRESPNAGVEKHVEYMLTWYSLACTVGMLWIILNLKFIKREGYIDPKADSRNDGSISR